MAKIRRREKKNCLYMKWNEVWDINCQIVTMKIDRSVSSTAFFFVYLVIKLDLYWFVLTVFEGNILGCAVNRIGGGIADWKVTKLQRGGSFEMVYLFISIFSYPLLSMGMGKSF